MNLSLWQKVGYQPITYAVYELIAISSLNIVIGIAAIIKERCDHIASLANILEQA